MNQGLELEGDAMPVLTKRTKANREIAEIASFLVAHGYDEHKVQQFFAPIAGNADVIDKTQSARE